MARELDAYNLAALNSATKYPSILTYHNISSRGVLTEERHEPPLDAPITLTEKVDGTNVRIVCAPGDFLIGSREDWLTARGDRIVNANLGIVDAVHAIALRLTRVPRDAEVIVFYGEVYGNKYLEHSKQYTTDGQDGFRLFDVALIDPEVLSWPREKIAHWREHDGQKFVTNARRHELAQEYGLDEVPVINQTLGNALPTTLHGALSFLNCVLPRSRVAVEGAGGQAEGLVARTHDRTWIAKLRFEDYHKALRGPYKRKLNG